MEWTAKGIALNWWIRDPEHARTRADVEVSATAVDVTLWTGGPAQHHEPGPPLRAVALNAAQARAAGLRPGGRILLERDRTAEAPPGALTPRCARVPLQAAK